jgi:hypothetical protein
MSAPQHVPTAVDGNTITISIYGPVTAGPGAAELRPGANYYQKQVEGED